MHHYNVTTINSNNMYIRIYAIDYTKCRHVAITTLLLWKEQMSYWLTNGSNHWILRQPDQVSKTDTMARGTQGTICVPLAMISVLLTWSGWRNIQWLLPFVTHLLHWVIVQITICHVILTVTIISCTHGSANWCVLAYHRICLLSKDNLEGKSCYVYLDMKC